MFLFSFESKHEFGKFYYGLFAGNICNILLVIFQIFFYKSFICLSSKEGSPSFVDCSREKIWQNLKPKLNCSIVGFAGFKVNMSDFPECPDKKSAGDTFWTFLPLVKGKLQVGSSKKWRQNSKKSSKG